MSATITIQTDRLNVARHATYEIDAILHMLQREQAAEPDSYAFGLILRTSVRRMDELNAVILSVTGDDENRTIEDMQRVVQGEA